MLFRHHSLIFAAHSNWIARTSVDITYMETYSELSTYTNNTGSFNLLFYILKRKSDTLTLWVNLNCIVNENSTLGFVHCKVLKIINVENIRNQNYSMVWLYHFFSIFFKRTPWGYQLSVWSVWWCSLYPSW